MQAELLFLGTGGSSGIPMIGCTCPVCTSKDAHNKRFRPSALVTIGDKRLLIDCGPDYRCQALQHHLDHLDGVLLTHSHFDHIAGLDELRAYFLHTKSNIPILLSPPTYEDLRLRCAYFFVEKKPGISLTAQLDFHILEKERGSVNFLGIEIGYMRYEQGGMPVTGFRFGPLAYISDIRHYPETIFEDLAGVKILVVSALRKEPSYMHFNLEEAVRFGQKIGVEKSYFTHIGHELGHTEGNALLPAGFQLAYDGLKVDFIYG